MMRLLFVGDGPRDCATVPHLVANILGEPVHPEFKAWKKIELIRGGGYQRKMLFAIAEARTLGLDGIIATVDCDKSNRREKLSSLRRAREQDRCKPLARINTAVGEAIPHLEAWLIDDVKAVRTVLGVDEFTELATESKNDPKGSLNLLIEASERTERPLEILAEIAQALKLQRCTHAGDTGFEEFTEDVLAEFRAC